MKGCDCRAGTCLRRIEEGEKTHEDELALIRRDGMASGNIPAGNCQNPEPLRSKPIENLIGFGLRCGVERQCSARIPAFSIAGLVRQRPSQHLFRRPFDDEDMPAIALEQHRDSPPFEIEVDLVELAPARGIERAGFEDCRIERAPKTAFEMAVEPRQFEDTPVFGSGKR